MLKKIMYIKDERIRNTKKMLKVHLPNKNVCYFTMCIPSKIFT